jgi:hypothetical protein
MGYAEEAKVNLGRAISGFPGEDSNRLLQIAQVQASLAVVEAVDELSSQVAYLSDITERQQGS